MISLTVKEKVVLHLNDYSPEEEGYTLPQEVTQKGIALAIGKERAVVAQALKWLVDAEEVFVKRGRVSGAHAAMKCYYLTGAGRERARRLSGLLADVNVEVDGQVVTGVEAMRMLTSRGTRRGVATIHVLEGDLPKGVGRGADVPGEVFVGRRDAVDTISSWGSGCLLVLGLGGMGKTALVRRAVTGDHIFLEWGEGVSMRDVLVALARGMFRSDGVAVDPSFECVCRMLAQRRLSVPVVLDNYTPTPHLDTLLGAIMRGGSALIVTSREVPGFIAGAGWSDQVGEIHLRELTPEESRSMLVLLGVPTSRVDGIVASAGGYPLALKLASRAGDLSLTRTGAMEVVHGVVSRSLSERECEVLKRISMISGSMHPDVLVDSGICAYYDIFELKRKCILVRDDAGYRLHDVLRELFRDGSARRWAARYYAALGTPPAHLKAVEHSVRCDAGLLVRLLEEGTGRLVEKGYAEDLHGVLEGALKDRSCTHLDPDQKACVEVSLASCEYVLGKRSALERLLTMGEERLRERTRVDRMRVMALCIFRFEGRWRDAVDLLERCASLCRSVNEPWGTLSAASAYVNTLSILAEHAEKRDDILEVYRGCRDVLTQAGEWYRSRGEHNLGVYYARTGEHKMAVKHLEAAISSAERFNDVRFLGNTRLTLGDVQMRSGRVKEAAASVRSALESFTKAGDALGMAYAHQTLGDIHLAEGRGSDALKEYERAVRAVDGCSSPVAGVECRVEICSSLMEHADLRKETLGLAERLANEAKGMLGSVPVEEKRRLERRLRPLLDDAGMVTRRGSRRRR